MLLLVVDVTLQPAVHVVVQCTRKSHHHSFHNRGRTACTDHTLTIPGSLIASNSMLSRIIRKVYHKNPKNTLSSCQTEMACQCIPILTILTICARKSHFPAYQSFLPTSKLRPREGSHDRHAGTISLVLFSPRIPLSKPSTSENLSCLPINSQLSVKNIVPVT